MQYNYQEFKSMIETKKFPSLVFIYSEEAYLARQLEQLLLDALVPEASRSLDFVRIKGVEAEKLTLEDIAAALSAPPFMARRRLVIIEDSKLFADKNPTGAFAGERKEQFLDVFRGLNDSVCLLFRESKIALRQKRFWTAVEELGYFVKIPRVEEPLLIRWLNALCSRSDLRISHEACQELILRSEGSMDYLYNDAQKLLKLAEQRSLPGIDLNLVEEAASPNLQADIFKLLDAIAAQNIELALELKSRLLARKEPIQLIQFMLARKIRQLLVAKGLGGQGEIASALKLPPFVARKLQDEARKFSEAELVAKYQELYISDKLVKTGRLKLDLAFDLAILKMGAV